MALPAIQREFTASSAELQWIISAYLMALAMFMAVAGRLADHVGRKRLFLAGLVLFGLASATAAAAPGLGILIGARFAQGIGGAVVQPLALATTTRAVGDDRRGWAIGLLATGGTTFLAVGPLAAGALLELGSWRWVFLVPLPVVALASVQAARWVEPSREPEPVPIEIPGVVLLVLGLAGTVVGVTQLAEWGRPALAPSLLGVALLAAFVRHELRSPRPLVQLRLLRDRWLSASLAALFAIQFVVLGTSVYLMLFLQHGLGESALTAGLVLALSGMFTPLLSTTTGHLSDRRGPRPLVVRGLLLTTAGLVWMALAAPSRNVLVLLPGLLAYSLSRPAVFTPASLGALATLPPGRRGLAAGLVTETRQLGAVLGVAVLGAVLTAVVDTSLTDEPDRFARGFAAAMLVAAAVAASAALLAWRSMPSRASDLSV